MYSDAAPYVDTNLACGRVTPNDAAVWVGAIDGLLDGGWQTAAEEAHVVRELRDLRRVAAECWWPAVQAAGSRNPLTPGGSSTSWTERGRWHVTGSPACAGACGIATDGTPAPKRRPHGS